MKVSAGAPKRDEGPDREYVDGRIVERNSGERDHSDPQGELIATRQGSPRTYVFPEQRVQVKATRKTLLIRLRQSVAIICVDATHSKAACLFLGSRYPSCYSLGTTSNDRGRQRRGQLFR